MLNQPANNQRPIGGFTLIELMVSIGVFAVVMTLAAGAYITVINMSRTAQAISTAVDSVSYAMEYMTREIRTGTQFGCNGITFNDCAAGGTSFSVLDQSGSQVTFSLQNSAINVTSSTYVGSTALTDAAVTITGITFYVSGTKPYSNAQDIAPPAVTIVVTGTVTTGKGAAIPFTVESGAEMRGIDL